MARREGFDIFPIFGRTGRGELPVGAEVAYGNGFIAVKISMRRIKNGFQHTYYNGTWKLKHHAIYEANFGRIPKGYVVIHLDGNKHNNEPDNLELATRNETMLLHHYGLQFNDAERTRTGLAIARHRATLGRLMKQTHNTYTMPKLKTLRGGTNGKV